MIRFIDEHRDQFGVEFLCRVLCDAVSGFLTSRGYRAAKTRVPCARQLKDELLVPEIQRLHEENYGVYGVRKMHALLRREGWDIGRDQTARLMKLAGVRGVARSKKVFTTKSDPTIAQPMDLVERDFTAPRAEPVVGRGHHVCRNVGGDGVCRVRDRRVLPHDRRLERRRDATRGGAAVTGVEHGRVGHARVAR